MSDKKYMVGFRLTAQEVAVLDKLAAEKGLSRSGMAKELLSLYLNINVRPATDEEVASMFTDPPVEQ